MTSLGGADRAIIRMKASRAVCSLKTGVSAGGGGRTVVVWGEGPIVEICSGDSLVGPKKRGNRITKRRDANTGGRVSVSSDKESGGRKGGDPNAIVKPDNAIDRRMCADIFSEGPKPQGFRVFKSVKGTVVRCQRV